METTLAAKWKKAEEKHTTLVSTSDVQGAIQRRIRELRFEIAAEKQELTDKFAQAANGNGSDHYHHDKKSNKKHVAGDMDFIGGVMLDMMLWGPLLAHFGQTLEGMGMLGAHQIASQTMISPVIEGISTLVDEEAYKNKARYGRVYDAYPEGRRSCKGILERFNTATYATGNALNDMTAELYELDATAKVAKQLAGNGLTRVQLDEDLTMREALTEVLKNAFAFERASFHKPAFRNALIAV